MTFMDALLKHNRPIWDACIATPFLSELADGSLPPAHFAGYMLQDAIYLNHYARSVGIAIACAQHFDELRLFGELLRAVTDEEMIARFAVLENYGILPKDLPHAEPLPACQAYLDFLDAACASNDHCTLLIALLPCMLSYSHIFQHLAAMPQSQNSRYWPFIRDYAASSFAADCARWTTFADVLCTPLSPAHKKMLAARFTKASQLELDFWRMADHPLGGVHHA